MKIPLYIFLTLLSPIAAFAWPNYVSVKSQFIEVDQDYDVSKNLNYLLTTTSAELEKKRIFVAQEPKTVVESGKTVTFDFRRIGSLGEDHPEHPVLGATISVTPQLTDDNIRFRADFEYSDFIGFVENSNPQIPTYNYCKADGIFGNAKSGETVWMAVPASVGEKVVSEAGQSSQHLIDKRKQILVFTFQKAEQDAAANP